MEALTEKAKAALAAWLAWLDADGWDNPHWFDVLDAMHDLAREVHKTDPTQREE